MKSRFAFVLGLFLLACGGDDDGGVDGGAVDGGARDGGDDVDGALALDASAEDGSAEDASADASPEDASVADARTDDASAEDAGPGCGYVAVNEVVVRCDGDFTFVNYFTSTVEGCDPFWGFSPEGPRFEDAASAIGSDPACDAGCQYEFSTSVTRLYCGRRTGYEILTAEGCPDAYRFSAGWYGSVEEHDAANPCTE